MGHVIYYAVNAEDTAYSATDPASVTSEPNLT